MNKLSRRMISLILAFLLVFSIGGISWAEDGEVKPEDIELVEGSFVVGQVVVMFRSGAVKDLKTSLRSAQSEENIGDNYGEALSATGETAEAAKDAKSEIDIVSRSLGDDFVIEDSVSVDDDLIIALVSSEKYDTEKMIELLSANEDVESVEPNYYLEHQSYEYSLNDPLNKYNYHANSPEAVNRDGENVSSRGTDPANTLSTNAGAAWEKYTGSEEDEVVVAVIDSGINYEHEDLRDVVWTNPGNIGLEGKHGFNFDDNAEDVMDCYGHGTHVSGIIGAAANNGAGVAGIGSGVGVKIMMLSTASATKTIEDTFYREIGAFNYVLKAKERGVNIVATSSSWGVPGVSTTYDELFDRMGEAGIISFVAACNDGLDIDKHSYGPAGGDSEYMLTVGCADITGEPSGFSNYGKTKVDLFAPGQNILSTVMESVYFPGIFTAERNTAVSDYYGQFSKDTVISQVTDETGTSYTVIPDTGDAAVNAFGPSVFHIQSSESESDDAWDEITDEGEESVDETGGEADETEETSDSDPLPDAVCTLSLSDKKFFAASSEKPASLEVTIDNAKAGEEYYLYFPYAKNPGTTGSDNTKFSIYTICGYEEGDISGVISGGEVVVTDEETGNCAFSGSGILDENEQNMKEAGCGKHFRPDFQSDDSLLLSAEDAEGKTIGLGVCVSPNGEEGSIGRFHFYLDSLGVSKPKEDIPEEALPNENNSYDIMSGTSMATPAAAGAYAVVAALYPRKDGQTGAEYAADTRDRYLSCVRRTESLKDLCKTGGYIDLSLLEEDVKRPVIIDAVCDISKKTITITGTNLSSEGFDLSYKSMANETAEEIRLPSGDMTLEYADDGKSIVISNAEALFGTYTKFILSDSTGVVNDAAFFLVKGQKKLDKVNSVRSLDGTAEYISRVILTDKDGRNLYGYDKLTGIVSKYNSGGFNNYAGTRLKDVVFDRMLTEGYNKFELSHPNSNFTVDLSESPGAVYSDNILYQFVKMSFTPAEEYTGDSDEDPDDPDEYVDTTINKYYLASIDYTAVVPEWDLREIEGVTEEVEAAAFSSGICAVTANDKIYCIMSLAYNGTDESYVCSYDTKSGEWSELDPIPAALNKASAYVFEGDIYVLSGYGFDEKLSRAVYRYDGNSWDRLSDIPFVGRFSGEDDGTAGLLTGGIAPVGNGLMFINCSADGAGNVFLYNTETGICEPSYYTYGDSFSDDRSDVSAVETRDGIYYLETVNDSGNDYDELYLLPVSSGVYESSFSAEPAISKKSAKLSAGKTVSLKVTGGTVSKWSSSDKKVATVKNGKVTALKKGTATITAVLTTGEKLTCKVRVTSSPKLSKKSITVSKGKTKTVTIKGKAASVKNVYKNTGKAKVVSKKTATKIKIKGLKKGKTTLKIKVNGVTLKLKVTVK